MKFGPCPVGDAQGAILAHSVKLGGRVLKKGTCISARDINDLRAEGHTRVTVAALGQGDIGEDSAALRIARILQAPGLRLGPAFTGRVNLIAEKSGVFRVNTALVNALNDIDEGLTLATLPDYQRVNADQLVATVKIIPYGLPEQIVNAGEAVLSADALTLSPFLGGIARLILTETPGFKPSLLKKGETIVRNRIEALGYRLDDVQTVPHDVDQVAEKLNNSSDLTLILGASATSDRADIAPAAVVQAGGEITRFGMPVDPGNLLFLGHLNGRPIVGLPGCARSPALNGVDWVLERLSAKLPIENKDISAMGVGGLLKEMAGRPQPRRPKS
jgi:molybdenum cofactor cytidylyltransferase